MTEASENWDRRSQILEAAFEEFAAKGFKGATIKGIAAAARLQSPALIYHYFPDKEALFREVMESRIPVVQAVTDLEPLMDLPPEKVLTRLGLAYLSFDRSNTQEIRLVIGEAIRRPEVAEAFIESGPGRVLEFLKRYLARQVETGRLRPHDVRSSARAFIGMLMPQVVGKVLFPALVEDGLTDEEHLKTTIEVFLKGLEPER
ncbi:MAG: TetR/AcrR family transcriptional regulator [Actinomycetota bacterium]|nr:TetR/AcrR family transcriptional regulator [Actinomycetota bacterium]